MAKKIEEVVQREITSLNSNVEDGHENRYANNSGEGKNITGDQNNSPLLFCSPEYLKNADSYILDGPENPNKILEGSRCSHRQNGEITKVCSYRQNLGNE